MNIFNADDIFLFNFKFADEVVNNVRINHCFKRSSQMYCIGSPVKLLIEKNNSKMLNFKVF
jgi:hypothetical protein